MTAHVNDIKVLRDRAKWREKFTDAGSNKTERLAFETAADLLELHDSTGISLDNWESARGLIEHLLNHSISDNGA